VILICCCIPIVFGSSATAVRPRSLGWVQLSPANFPAPRSYLAMTYDPASGKVIAFGGFGGTGYLNDTWTFDGTTWTQIAAQSAPPARAAAQMAYDSVSQKVVLFGGYDGTNYWRHLALGWDNFTVDTGHAHASASSCHRSDAVSRSKWQGRSFWRL